MKLTLTYQGPLPPTQRGVSPIKAQLRQAFHPQVKQQAAAMLGGASAQYVTSRVGGFDFVSPAHERFRTAVELDILLLTRSGSRNLGDTDNRLKTLIDGLTRPANEQQLQEFGEPEDGGPTFCLLDDDGLVSRMTLDSREWLVPDIAGRDVLVVVTAKIVPGRNADMSAPTGTMFAVL